MIWALSLADVTLWDVPFFLRIGALFTREHGTKSCGQGTGGARPRARAPHLGAAPSELKGPA